MRFSEGDQRRPAEQRNPQHMGVAQPHGTKAERLGLGPDTPPSRRARCPNGRQALDIPA